MMDETKVIEKVQSGQVDEYADLVNRYQTGLIIHCENILHDRDNAEDIAQEAFIKAYEKLGEFNPKKARFSTWLYRIATNLAVDHLRQTRRTVNVDDIEELAGSTTPLHIDDDEKESIRKAILRLEPPKYCQIIQAYYWQGKSYEQLASELETNTSTIGTWMRRAKLQLRKELSL
jgi:RNA polymerase sigma-70 factor, ECF subfamily